MSHIAFFNIPALGHVHPTLPVVRELIARGHRVTYPAVADRAALVGETGAAVVAYESSRPSDADPHFRVPGGIGGSLLNFLTEAELTLPQWEAIVAADPPDLVVFDRMAFAGSVLARKHGIPAVQLWPMLVSGPQWTWAAPVDPSCPDYSVYQTRLDKFLANQGVSMDLLAPDVVRHIAFLPRAFQPHAELFGEVEFVGPCLRSSSKQDKENLLLITLGSLNNLHLDFYQTCFDAFAGTHWRVVMPVGKRFDPALLNPPANFTVSQYVPQLDVLARAKAFVSHAGLGGVLEAVCAGVPQVAVARTAEQGANAKRIAELGVGVSLQHATLTASALHAAVSALDDPLIATAVSALRLEIIASGGTLRAADVIEECLSG